MVERKARKSQQVPEGENVRHLSMDVIAGSEITATIAKAINRANLFEGLNNPTEISFEFNGVNISVRKDSDPQLIKRDWSRALNGYIDSAVGPYPPQKLTDEDKANDAKIEAEYQARRSIEDKKRKAEEREHRERVEAKLKDAPAIEVADKKAWKTYKDNNSDFYSQGVISYSERWARLMQIEIAQGRSVEDVAEETSHEADIDGITGFMYGYAVGILAYTWAYGEKLRRWHNLTIQIGNEGERANERGEVLNPALFTMGPSDE